MIPLHLRQSWGGGTLGLPVQKGELGRRRRCPTKNAASLPAGTKRRQPMEAALLKQLHRVDQRLQDAERERNATNPQARTSWSAEVPSRSSLMRSVMILPLCVGGLA